MQLTQPVNGASNKATASSSASSSSDSPSASSSSLAGDSVSDAAASVSTQSATEDEDGGDGDCVDKPVDKYSCSQQVWPLQRVQGFQPSACCCNISPYNVQ